VVWKNQSIANSSLINYTQKRYNKKVDTLSGTQKYALTTQADIKRYNFGACATTYFGFE